MLEPIGTKSIFYQVFMRDKQKCVYCGKDMMESFDSFAQIDNDHLKPNAIGGADDDVSNRVISCRVCNTLKGTFDPMPNVELNTKNRKLFLDEAIKYVGKRRTGEISGVLYRDYTYWKIELE